MHLPSLEDFEEEYDGLPSPRGVRVASTDEYRYVLYPHLLPSPLGVRSFVLVAGMPIAAALRQQPEDSGKSSSSKPRPLRWVTVWGQGTWGSVSVRGAGCISSTARCTTPRRPSCRPREGCGLYQTMDVYYFCNLCTLPSPRGVRAFVLAAGIPIAAALRQQPEDPGKSSSSKPRPLRWVTVWGRGCGGASPHGVRVASRWPFTKGTGISSCCRPREGCRLSSLLPECRLPPLCGSKRKIPASRPLPNRDRFAGSRFGDGG